VRVIVLGGSFNPPHLGHLILAEEMRREFGYDKVVLVPSKAPPHKTVANDPGPELRLEMTRAAVEGDDSFIVDDCELGREGPSYSIDTIRSLRGRLAFEGNPGLVVGDDLIPGFGAWREAEALSREADIVCARRTGAPRVDLPYPHRWAGNMLIPISSSLVRERIASGEPFRRLVPEGVFRIIQARGLYPRHSMPNATGGKQRHETHQD